MWGRLARIELDEKVWARMTAPGTHRASLTGFAATGRSFVISVLDVCRSDDGKIVEHWRVPDRFALKPSLTWGGGNLHQERVPSCPFHVVGGAGTGQAAAREE